MLMRVAPVLFVLLWSTGFIGSKLGAADAEPFTFLSLRFLAVLALLVPLVLLRRRSARGWPERAHAMVAGTLIHGAYLGGVFWAIRHGMPAGVAALIVSLQPIATAVLAGPLFGERLSARHWLGLALGLVGAVLILSPKLEGLRLASGAVIGGAGGTGAAASGLADAAVRSAATGINAATIAATLLALAGITAGTLYQKKFAGRIDLMVGAVWQYVGALAVIGPASLLLETRAVNWTPNFIFALGWLVVVLSIGAISLLMMLIRQNAVASVSGLFYMVPAVTAVIAYALFGETLNALQFSGLMLATVAVLLIAAAQPKGASPPPEPPEPPQPPQPSAFQR